MACVGGMLSQVRPLQNNSLQHSFTDVQFDVRWYRSITNRSMIGIASSISLSVGRLLKVANALFTFGNISHIFQAVFFDTLARNET